MKDKIYLYYLTLELQLMSPKGNSEYSKYYYRDIHSKCNSILLHIPIKRKINIFNCIMNKMQIISFQS